MPSPEATDFGFPSNPSHALFHLANQLNYSQIEEGQSVLFNDTEQQEQEKIMGEKMKKVFDLPEKEEFFEVYSSWLKIEKEGFLLLKKLKANTYRTATYYSNYFFQLKNNMLTYYDNSSQLYFPQGSIDLSKVEKIIPIKNYQGLKLLMEDKKIYLKADTKQTMLEWKNDLETAMFRAKHTGDYLKVVLPFSHIKDLSLVHSELFGDSIIIRSLEESEEDYLFSYFRDARQVYDFIKQMANSYLQENQKETRKDGQDDRQKDFIARLNFKNSKLENSQAGKLLGFSAKTSPEPPAKQRDEQTEFLKKQFPTLFTNSAIPKVLCSASAYLFSNYTVLPRLGKVFVTKDYLLFTGNLVGIRTKAILPLNEFVGLEKADHQIGFWYGLYCGLQLGELWLEFHSLEVRELFYETLSSLLSALTESSGSNESSANEEVSAENIEEKNRSINRKKRTQSISVLLDQVHSHDTDFSFPGPAAKSELMPPIANLPVEKTPIEPMKIVCITIGTRGDVQPFLALCKGLQKRGHSCVLATHDEYQQWIESHGIEFRSISGNPADLMQLCVDNGMFSLSFIREATSKFRSWIDSLLVSIYQASIGADCLIESPTAMGGFHVAEKLKIPFMSAFPMPWTRTREMPHPFAVLDKSLGFGYHILTWTLIEGILWNGIQPQINRFRKQVLNLNPIYSGSFLQEEKVPFLYSFSEQVVKQPSDWNTWIKLCGYWFLDQPEMNWQSPVELEAFLQQRDKPLVYIGFGSIIVQDPDALTKVIIEAVKLANVRAVISKGWSARSKAETGQTPANTKDLYFLSSVPHDWLFPRVDAVVHHGGAGTTAAGLRAGQPTIIKPFFGDQYFWASRVSLLGVGYQLKRLDVENLSEALIKVTRDSKMKQRAHLLGEKIRSENGVEKAIEYIHYQIPLLKKKIEEKVPNESKNLYLHQDRSRSLTQDLRRMSLARVYSTFDLNSQQDLETRQSNMLQKGRQYRFSSFDSRSKKPERPSSGYSSDSSLYYKNMSNFDLKPKKLRRKSKQKERSSKEFETDLELDAERLNTRRSVFNFFQSSHNLPSSSSSSVNTPNLRASVEDPLLQSNLSISFLNELAEKEKKKTRPAYLRHKINLSESSVMKKGFKKLWPSTTSLRNTE